MRLLGVLVIAACGSTPKPVTAPEVIVDACASADHRAFDFWVGDWDVSPDGTTKLVAHSKIERLYGGCAIRENWMPIGKPGGGSLSSFVADDHTWRQTWVDSSGARADFSGGIVDGAMVLSGPWANVLGPGQTATVRMTYTLEPDGSVRQHGETTTDAGATYQPSFDFIYRRAR